MKPSNIPLYLLVLVLLVGLTLGSSVVDDRRDDGITKRLRRKLKKEKGQKGKDKQKSGEPQGQADSGDAFIATNAISVDEPTISGVQQEDSIDEPPPAMDGTEEPPTVPINVGEEVGNVPPNDQCTDAIMLEMGDVVAGTTENATSDGLEGSCGAAVYLGDGVWYSIMGDGDVFQATITPSAAVVMFSISTGTCDSLMCVDGAPAPEETGANLVWLTEKDTQYLIFVSFIEIDIAGPFELTLTKPIVPTNNNCENAIELNINDEITSTTEFATRNNSTDCTGKYQSIL